jgi:hypothetical protein
VGTGPDVPFERSDADDVQPVQLDVAVPTLPDVPDEDAFAVVVVGRLGPRARARYVATAYVEPITLRVPPRYVDHDPSSRGQYMPLYNGFDPGPTIAADIDLVDIMREQLAKKRPD